ncbi:MAG: hypothetical protein R3B83_16685 [Nitrospirales bacterium]|nr:hypothetical protein [Nitrospira sp.]MCB9709893.1 hypothetical protein [Nitrospiraceae bacterium]MDR4489136.1 hypothetical protein [Nitrospirales bacterium]
MPAFSLGSLIRNTSLLGITALLLGCGSLSGSDLMAERYMACPMDSVWNSSLESLKAYPVTVKDKANGLIETGWRVEYVQGRGYGLLQREGMGDKERSQLTLTMKPLESNTVRLQIAERRQHWGFRGGSRIYDWYPVAPSQREVDHILNNLTKKLEAEGCFVES